MKKTYVLDTNVLIQSPASLLCFEENNLVLPIVCLEELDKLKTEDGECGSNARACIRFLEKLRQEGNLLEGVTLSNGGCLRIEPNFINIVLPPDFSNNKNDNRILQVCRGLCESGESVILVTKDILVRLKAQMLGIEAQDFTNEQAPSLDGQYTGRNECYVSDEAMSSFKKKGICLEDAYTYIGDEKQSVTPIINEFYILRSEINLQKTLLARFDGNKFTSLNYSKHQPFGIKPKNLGQYFLQEA